MESTSASAEFNPLDALTYAVGTDLGRRREENQDSYGVIEEDAFRFYIVADGMGGAKGGGTASSKAIEVVQNALSSGDAPEVSDIIKAVECANNDIFEMGSSDESLNGMGTTFVGIAFVGTKSIIVNVGDSRAYRIRKSSIFQLTSDHTLVNELLKTGAINPDQVENHPVAHMLTRSLGPTSSVEVDCWVAEGGPARGDKYLLCSDGLYNLVEDHEMLRIVNEYPMDEAVQELIDLANERGGTDNITVMLIEVKEQFPVTIMDYPEAVREEAAQRMDPGNGTSAGRAVSRYDGLSDQIDGKSDDKVQEAEQEVLADDSAALDLKHREESTGDKVKKWARLGLFGVVLLFAGTQIDRFTGLDKKKAPANIIFNPLAAAVAPAEMAPDFGSTRLLTPAMELPLSPSARLSLLKDNRSAGGVDLSDLYSGGTLTRRQMESLMKRQNALRENLEKLKTQLSAFDKPLTGEIMSSLTSSEEKIRKKRRTYNDLSSELDKAARRLSVWYGRRQRLEGEDPVDMASEIAVSSKEVLQKKKLFERATWEYLNKVEDWRFNPSDQKLAKSVAKLGRIREEKKIELATAVRAAIDKNKAESEKVISDLTVKRDKINSEIESLNSNIKFVKALTSGNKSDRERMRSDLLAEKKHLESELSELQKMLGK